MGTLSSTRVVYLRTAVERTRLAFMVSAPLVDAAPHLGRSPD